MRATRLLRRSASSASPGSNADQYAKSLAYASNLVRRQDHEGVWASYFYPQQLQPAYWALRAFNVELAALPDQVSNQMIGRMRFQWWKDAVKGLYEVSPTAPPFGRSRRPSMCSFK